MGLGQRGGAVPRATSAGMAAFTMFDRFSPCPTSAALLGWTAGSAHRRITANAALRSVHLHWFSRRTAVFLALVAALVFVLNNALHAHPMPGSGGHGHAVSHGPAAAFDDQVVEDVVVNANAADHDGSSPAPGADTHANCCCTCHAAVVLPSLHAHAIPFVVKRTMALANHRPGDSIVPEGPRRPPRPLGIA
jgi:hypothetical protein